MIEQDVWIIVSKDREWIATGTPRDRHLTRVSEYKNTRILTYQSKKKAENGFKLGYFYCSDYHKRPVPDQLEAVHVKVKFEEVVDD